MLVMYLHLLQLAKIYSTINWYNEFRMKWETFDWNKTTLGTVEQISLQKTVHYT